MDGADEFHGVEPQDHDDLRLAIVMNGGASLAVWIGGSPANSNRALRGESAYGGPRTATASLSFCLALGLAVSSLPPRPATALPQPLGTAGCGLLMCRYWRRLTFWLPFAPRAAIAWSRGADRGQGRHPAAAGRLVASRAERRRGRARSQPSDTPSRLPTR